MISSLITFALITVRVRCNASNSDNPARRIIDVTRAFDITILVRVLFVSFGQFRRRVIARGGPASVGRDLTPHPHPPHDRVRGGTGTMMRGWCGGD